MGGWMGGGVGGELPLTPSRPGATVDRCLSS